jgi:hypothetical protein
MSESMAGRVSVMGLAGLSMREIRNVDFLKYLRQSQEGREAK